MPLNISAAPLDGSWDLVAGTCKRIVFTVPLTPRSDQLQFVVQNMDFRAEKFVHWCGLNIKKVVYLSKGDIRSLKSSVIFAKTAKVGGLKIKFFKSQIRGLYLCALCGFAICGSNFFCLRIQNIRKSANTYFLPENLLQR